MRRRLLEEAALFPPKWHDALSFAANQPSCRSAGISRLASLPAARAASKFIPSGKNVSRSLRRDIMAWRENRRGKCVAVRHGCLSISTTLYHHASFEYGPASEILAECAIKPESALKTRPRRHRPEPKSREWYNIGRQKRGRVAGSSLCAAIKRKFSRSIRKRLAAARRRGPLWQKAAPGFYSRYGLLDKAAAVENDTRRNILPKHAVARMMLVAQMNGKITISI